jgi:hypothetical protein
MRRYSGNSKKKMYKLLKWKDMRSTYFLTFSHIRSKYLFFKISVADREIIMSSVVLIFQWHDIKMPFLKYDAVFRM